MHAGAMSCRRHNIAPCYLQRQKARRQRCAALPEACGKTRFFPRNDRLYVVKRNAFQTENALERFYFEKDETRGGGTAPPGPTRTEKSHFFRETTDRMV